MVAIAAGESRDFPLDIYTIPADWQPGEYEIWVHNDLEDLGSNKIRFRLEANADSVSHLLRMAEAESTSPDPLENHHIDIRREFAINWLRKNFPDLILNPITDLDTQEVVEAKYKQNHKFAGEFREKWKERKDSPETKMLFAALNSDVRTEAPGLTPPVVKPIEAIKNGPKPPVIPPVLPPPFKDINKEPVKPPAPPETKKEEKPVQKDF